ncbi:hypothetical protein WJX82_009330 [Trebouxia sp. C0006]
MTQIHPGNLHLANLPGQTVRGDSGAADNAKSLFSDINRIGTVACAGWEMLHSSSCEFIRKGRTILAAVYTFRSVAKASLKDVTPAGSLSASLQQQTVYQPALKVVAAAQQFCTEVGEALIMIFVGMIAPDGIGVNSSQALLRHMTMLFDQIHVLDALKTAKASLADSIAMAKHAQQQHNSSFGQQQQDQEEEADFDGLLEFLEDPWWCVKMLHSNTKQVNYQHRVVGRMVQYICESLTDKENSAPQVVGLESHVYLRALPVALYLLFPSDEGKIGLEAIGSRQMQRGLKLLKQKPVVPAIGDLPLSLMHLLHQLSPFLVAHGQENKESGILPADQLGSKQHAAVGQQYDLQRKTAAVVVSHDAFTEAFAGYAVQMDDYRMTGQAAAPQLLQQGLVLATEGLKHVSTWSLKPPLGTQPVPAVPVLRPAGAFSYTAPPIVPSTAPASADRYIPAVGFSPSRARVARVTSRPLTSSASAAPHLAVTTAKPQPATARQAIQPQAPADIPSSATEQVIIAESVGVPAAPPVTSPPKRNSDKLRNATGVCDTVPAIPVAVAQVPGPSVSIPERTQQGLITDGPVLKDGGYTVGGQTMTSAGEGSTPEALLEGPDEGNLAGLEAEGLHSSAALDSDSDAWTDADSDDSPTGQAAGPVCEGVETNSDAWSDSIASEPDSPVANSQAATTGPQPVKRSRFALPALAGSIDEPTGQQSTVERVPLTAKDPEEVLHVNTQLGLSAGLPSTFGSFMAAAPRAPAEAVSGSPHKLPLPSLDLAQAPPYQENGLDKVAVEASTSVWASSEARMQRSVTAGGNTSASHYASTSAVHASSYDGVTYSSQHEEAAPVASQEPDPKDNTAVIAATTDEEGLQSDDVTLEVAEATSTIAPTTSAPAEAFKSGKADCVASNPIELPPVFEYGSDADGSGSPDTRNAPAVTIVTTEGLSKEAVRAIEAPASPSDMGPVQYPAFAGSVPAPMDEYAPYPELSPVSEAPQVTQRTELFLDYYSDVSRYDYQPGDLACMLEMLACIKGVAALLQQADVWLSGYICQAVFLQMQGFVQLAMTHLDPRNKGMPAVRVLHNALGSPSAPQAAPAPITKAKTFQKAKSLLSFRHQGSTAASFGSNHGSMLPAAYPALPPGQQQVVQQVAPTCVQMLTLQYTAEQMIKEEAGGKQWMKSVMDTESSLSKDVKRFLSASQSWEPALTLSASCQQAADMSALWLKEIHLENTLPSHSQPLVHSVPWQLAHHALVYPQERHIEVVLQSLEIYNDVQCSAVPALTAQHLAAEAQADAEVCTRKLITNLATEAFVQYKTAAANSLTDCAFIRAQYRDTVLPIAGVLRQFEELFRQHNVVVMGHSVDLGSAVAAHVQGLLYSNAQYLVALCEASNITSLVSLKGQVAVLQNAHAMLSAHLELDTWAQIWAEADGQQAFDAFSGRIAHCITVQVLTDVLPNFGYCEPTQRFTRLAAQEARLPEPEADLPAFAYGPGGSVSGAFGVWASAHQGWLGQPHLEALMKLTGPAGLAMVVTAVMQHLGQLLQGPLPSALRPLLQNYPDELLRVAHSGGAMGNAAGLLAHVQHQVQQMLMFRGDWQAALPKLTELGNGLALITSLDAVLGAQGDAISMQLAPMLGVSVSSAGHLQRMDQDALTPLAAALRGSQSPSAQAQAQEAEAVAWQASGVASLTPHFLHSLHQSLQASLAELEGGSVKFCHAWSVLMLALASSDQANQQQAASASRQGQSQYSRPVELSSYGDGLLWGAGLLLHLLNQTAWFKLTDLSALIVQRQQLEYRIAGSAALPQDLAVFLMKAQAARGSINCILSSLSALQPQLPQPITVQTSASGPPLQYAPEAASFAAAPAQTAAVLTDAEAKQQLAWASAHLAQAAPVQAATPDVSQAGPLASQASGLGYAKGPLAYSVNGSHDVDSDLILAGNVQRLHAEHSRSSMAASLV